MCIILLVVKGKLGKISSLKILWKWLLVPNFSLIKKFRFFGPNQSKKGISDLKKRKTKITIKYYTYSNCSKFQISACMVKFQTNKYGFLKQFSQIRMLPSKNRKIEHHHWIIHIQVSLKYLIFTLNKQFWILGLNLPKTGIFCHKQKK